MGRELVEALLQIRCDLPECRGASANVPAICVPTTTGTVISGASVRLNCRGAACRQIDECFVVARARFSVGEWGLLAQVTDPLE